MGDKDVISLRGMIFYGYHGALPEEKRLGQQFIIDVDLYLDLNPAGQTDQVEDTMNYAQVYACVQRIVEGERFSLIERLAERLAGEILSGFSCRKIRVKVHKPQAPIPGTIKDVSVVIWREKIFHHAYLSLGSNLGPRGYYLKEGIRRLSSHPQIKVTAESHLYETEPWGKKDQPAYWNQVLAVETDLEPNDLLKTCQAIEDALGRIREERWGPRTLDIDILLYDNKVSDTPDLQLPHPQMEKRSFVLVPLAEIAPDLTLPSGIPVREARGEGRVERI